MFSVTTTPKQISNQSHSGHFELVLKGGNYPETYHAVVHQDTQKKRCEVGHLLFLYVH